MKQILGLTIMTLCLITDLRAATTYNINSNTNWSTSFSSYCGTCTINIATGVTLTLDNSGLCDNCTITGGTIKITGGFSFQSTSISNTTINATSSFTLNNTNSFNNVTAVISGSSGLTSNGGLTISNSTFTFQNTASFTSNSQLNLDNTIFNFNANSHFLSNSSTVNLKDGSKLIAGDGSKGSQAYLIFYGQLNLVDASSYVIISNVNNYYLSWNTYTSASNSKSYTTTNNNQNCGGAGQNACSSAYYYGGTVLNSSGPLPISILPITISGFNAFVNNNKVVKLSWALSDASGQSYLQVERSTNAQDFVPLTMISADQSDTTYAYTDESPASGENDYRIKIITADGNISYSKIISAQLTETGSTHIFPNPSTGGNFQIQFPVVQSAILSVYTIDGRLLYMSTLNGQSLYAIHIPLTVHTSALIARVVTKESSSTFTLLNNQ